MCPQCDVGRVSANQYQVRCDRCAWVVLDPDPLYSEYLEKLGWSNVSDDESIQDAINALPSDLGALLTTTTSALPGHHPAISARSSSSSTAAEFRIDREALGLSAEWLADRLGVALKTVQRWENGHRAIPEGVVVEMGTALYAMYAAARTLAEHLLETPGAVMMIPRTGTYLGFPASWYRALTALVREVLSDEYGEEGGRLVNFRLVYMDEVEAQQ